MVLPSLLAALSLGAFAPYGTAPFEEAARTGRPVLLVVRDLPRPAEDPAFSDPSLTPLLQERYVLVETDTLDRPDVADLAELALVVLEAEAGPGPRVLLLTPAGKPFAGRRGTEPPEALRELLQRGYSEFRGQRKLVEERAGRVLSALRAAQLSAGTPAPIAEELLARTARRLRESPDRAHSGPARLFLLAHHARTGDASALASAARASSTAPVGFAERALQVEADARTARTQGDAARRVAVLAAATELASALPAEGELPAGRDGVAADVGVVLQALAGAAQSLEAPELLAPAQRLAQAARTGLGPFTTLRHRAGSTHAGALDDHAHLALGLLALDAASGETRWRTDVVQIVDAALGHFGDLAGGAFFATAAPTEPLGLRTRTVFDGRLPSGNGTFLRVLLRLSSLTGEARYRDLAQRTLLRLVPVLAEAPAGLETVALAMGESLAEPGAANVAAGTPEPSPSVPAAVGPVRASAVLSREALRPGETVSARVRLDMPDGWSVVAPAGQRPLFAFTVSVPGVLVPAGRPVYPAAGEVPAAGAAPAFPAFFSGAIIDVPLRAPLSLPAGPARLLLRLRYQACQGPHCGAPDGATLSVPFTVLPPAR